VALPEGTREVIIVDIGTGRRLRAIPLLQAK
jgi:hypothetical protein